MVTRKDVAEAYRIFLNRAPESDAAVEDKLTTCPDHWSLVEHFFDSEEFRIRMHGLHGPQLSSLDPRCSVQMACKPDELQRIRDRVQETWSQLGRSEPHYSVLTGPEFLPETMNTENQALFYATGAAYVEELMAVLRRNGLAIPKGLVLDFGCGLGRVGEHLSAHFERYLGVDISSSHLALARRHFLELGRTNVEFESLPEFMAGHRCIDLFYSVLVLQHNPPPVMLDMLDQILRRINITGLGFFQIPTAIFDYHFDILSYSDSRRSQNQMEMHALPQSFVFEVVHSNNCRVVEVYPDNNVGPLGESFHFLVQKMG